MRPAIHRLLRSPPTTPLPHLHRTLSTTPHPPTPHNALPPRPTLPESSLLESFLKGSGPGGQKINKTSCAVQLTHLPTGLQVKCQATRSRMQNRKIARRILAERVEEGERGGESRVGVRRERERRRRASGVKKRGRKYRALGEGGEEVVRGELVADEDGEWEEEGVEEGEEGGDEEGQSLEGGEAATGPQGEEQITGADRVQALFEEARKTLENAEKNKGK